MIKLNGTYYFEKRDISSVIDRSLNDVKELKGTFLESAKTTETSYIVNAIKIFKKELLFSLNYETALNYNAIENVYIEISRPADQLLGPIKYDEIPFESITSFDMKKYENWLFNYGITVVIKHFELFLYKN